MSLQINAVGKSHPGKVRSINEDAVYTFVRPPAAGGLQSLLIVADGVGGHMAGEVASQLAVETIKENLNWFLEQDQSQDTKPNLVLKDGVPVEPDLESVLELRLRRAIQIANEQIFAYSRENRAKAGNLGTTLTCAIFREETMVIGHVGDSRAYRLRDGKLEQLTDDHSFVGALIREGQLEKEAIYTHPRRHVITRALGQNPEVLIDFWKGRFQEGDKFILCTDGMWEMVRDEEIQQTIAESPDLETAADRLIETANENGGPDNITIVISEIKAGGDASTKNRTLRS